MADNREKRAGDGPWRARLAVAGDAVAADATVGVMILVIQVCRLTLTGRRSSPDGIWWLVFSAIAVAAAAIAVQILGRALGRQTAARRDEELRLAVVTRLRADANARTSHTAWTASGATLSRDITSAGQLVGRSSELVYNLLVLLLSIAYLFWISWRMTLVALLPILLGFVALGVVTARFMSDMKDEYIATVGAIDSARPDVDLDALLNRRGAQARTAATNRAAARRLADAADQFARYFQDKVGVLFTGRGLAEIGFSTLTVVTFVLVGGALLVHAHWVTPIDIVPPLLVGSGLAAPILAFTYLSEDTTEGQQAAKRVLGFCARAQAASPGPAGQPPPVGQAAGEPPPGLAVELPERGLLTIVESSPEGAGQVLDWLIATLPPERVVAVTAEPAVVIGPVGKYITADRPVSDSSRDEAERAARIAAIHDTITRLPDGYDSVVGREASLSYREGQRVALARAVAGNRDIVLVDARAFAGDARKQSALEAAADAVRETAAMILVSSSCPPELTGGHLVLLDAGRVIESGTHDELIRAGGSYAARSGYPAATLSRSS
jgi:ATP-binding cassette subfamily B protein